MLKEIFHDSLKISTFTMIDMENHARVLFSHKSFLFSAAFAIATFEIYG